MSYQINSPNAQDDFQIDQYRLNRLGGANLDYQLAQIANEHPDWTPTQVRMAQSGGLGGAPSTRLLTGFGLPARYRITGADPQDEPPTSSVNPGGFGANSIQNSFMRQQNAFRLGQISKAQSQLDKLDPKDDDDAEKISELKGRIGALTEETQSNPTSEPQAAVPLGEGTAGEEAPIYQPGGPDASRQLSNGGSVYFGSVAGAPPFRAGPQTTPPQSATAPNVANPGNYFPGTQQPFSIPGPITDDSGDSAPAAPVVNLSPKQFKKRGALQSQIKAAGDNGSPQYIIDGLNAKAAAFDSTATNPPAAFSVSGTPQPFSIGPQDAASDPNPDFTGAQKQLQASGFLKGAKPAAPTIASQADYEALSPGSQYVDPSGTLRTKAAAAQGQ
jgi:hypothetical protein